MFVDESNLDLVMVMATREEIRLLCRVTGYIAENYNDDALDLMALNASSEEIKTALSEISQSGGKFTLSRQGYFGLSAAMTYGRRFFSDVTEFESDGDGIEALADALVPLG